MIPTPQVRHIPKRRRWIPDPKPEGGYRVEPMAEITSSLAGLDHVAEIRAALQRLTEADELMDRLERRLNRLYARLQDETLTAQYPADHPLRIEAEDRVQAIDKAWTAALVNATQWAGLIKVHGDYLRRNGQEVELDLIGRGLIRGWGPLGRVETCIEGLMTTFTWQRLANAAVPF